MIFRIIATLLAHYRRHPGQLAMLLLGLWVASALWSSVQAINATAKDSYARANSLFSVDIDQLARQDGLALDVEDYLALRQAGFPVSPMLEGSVVVSDTRLTLIGIDPLTLPASSESSPGDDDLAAFLSPPWQTQLAPDTLVALGLTRQQAPGATPAIGNQRLPPLNVRPALPPNTLILDIAAVSMLLGDQATLSLVTAAGALSQPPDGYRITRAVNVASPEQLTDSFHLNLTALAMLSLVVGLFIVQAALGLAMEQRVSSLRTLRALGVPAVTLTFALLIELLLIGTVGAALGLTSGLWLAGKLLPDVASTLSTLYQTDVQRSLALPWHYWLGSVAITFGGLLLAGSGMLWRAANLPIIALGQRQAWRLGYQRQLLRFVQAGGVMAVITLGLALWLSQLPPGQGVLISFGLVASLLLTCALSLPPLLSGTLHLSQRLLRRYPLSHFAIADLQLQLPRLALAMMALLIALATNLGVSSMVGGFRLTFLEWLDQRLVAPLYINASPATLPPLLTWLDTQPDVLETLPTARGSSELLGINQSNTPSQSTTYGAIDLFGITPTATLISQWPLLATQQGADAAWLALSNHGVFINEQMAVARALSPGDTLTLATHHDAQLFTVAAIYPDYGNPKQQLLFATTTITQRFGGELSSIGVRLQPHTDLPAFRQALADRFNLAPEALVNQQEVKQVATQIFERTFSITRALNGLTLGVAALALLASLLAQAEQRQRQLATLWALGVPRITIAQLPLFQLGGLALLTGLLAIPLGIAITWLLVAKINVAAFGWRLPLQLFPGDTLIMLLTAVSVALLAAALPSLKLWRTSPRTLLNKDTQ